MISATARGKPLGIQNFPPEGQIIFKFPSTQWKFEKKFSSLCDLRDSVRGRKYIKILKGSHISYSGVYINNKLWNSIAEKGTKKWGVRRGRHESRFPRGFLSGLFV
jgi:hypothetical protein